MQVYIYRSFGNDAVFTNPSNPTQEAFEAVCTKGISEDTLDSLLADYGYVEVEFCEFDADK